MLLWLLVWLPLCAGEEGERLVAALAAAGRPRAALCLRGGACGGALWARRWLLAPATCLRERELAGARVLLHRAVGSCRNITDDMLPIGVMARFEHPQFSWQRDDWAPPVPPSFDAALVLLDAPALVPPCDNYTRAMEALPTLAPWLRSLPEQIPAARDRPPAPRPAGLTHWRVADTPMRLLATAVVAPLASLLLLFAAALRYSWGQPEELPYDALERDSRPDCTPERSASAPPEAAGDVGKMHEFLWQPAA